MVLATSVNLKQRETKPALISLKCSKVYPTRLDQPRIIVSKKRPVMFNLGR